MAEYIDRKETVDALERLCNRVCQYSKAQRFVMCSSCPLGDAFTVIEDDIYEADVVPVRHGRWIPYNVKDCLYVCSECHSLPKDRTRYCPNCGARMDKEVDA